jgi:hypothetical protein
MAQPFIILDAHQQGPGQLFYQCATHRVLGANSAGQVVQLPAGYYHLTVTGTSSHDSALRVDSGQYLLSATQPFTRLLLTSGTVAGQGLVHCRQDDTVTFFLESQAPQTVVQLRLMLAKL